jgi:sugar/nucleoside kinase (ribokinase family)
VDAVCDPTGAGDSFAGAFLGALAASGEVSPANVKRALLYGSVVASFGVEAFSLERLEALERGAIESRMEELIAMTRAD